MKSREPLICVVTERARVPWLIWKSPRRGALRCLPYGERTGTIKDPFGHRWMIATPVEDAAKEELQQRVGAAYTIS